MGKIQNTDAAKFWQECEAPGSLIHCWWDCKMVQLLWKTVWRFLVKLNILVSCNLAIIFLGIYSKGFKTYVHSKTCTWMFTVALITMVRHINNQEVL